MPDVGKNARDAAQFGANRPCRAVSAGSALARRNELTGDGWLFVVVTVLAFYSVRGSVVYEIEPDATGTDYVALFTLWFARRAIGCTPTLIALTIADNTRVAGVRRLAVLLFSLLVSAQLAAMCKCLCPLAHECAGFASGGWRFRMFTEDGMWTTIIGDLLAFACCGAAERRFARSNHGSPAGRARPQRACVYLANRRWTCDATDRGMRNRP